MGFVVGAFLRSIIFWQTSTSTSTAASASTSTSSFFFLFFFTLRSPFAQLTPFRPQMSPVALALLHTEGQKLNYTCAAMQHSLQPFLSLDRSYVQNLFVQRRFVALRFATRFCRCVINPFMWTVKLWVPKTIRIWRLKPLYLGPIPISAAWTQIFCWWVGFLSSSRSHSNFLQMHLL